MAVRTGLPPRYERRGDMQTPNTAEVLRDEAKEAERRRILLLAYRCKTLEELIARLEAEDQK